MQISCSDMFKTISFDARIMISVTTHRSNMPEVDGGGLLCILKHKCAGTNYSAII